MNIIITAKMGSGTFEAKLVPLSLVNKISQIFVLRKKSGPKINKVKYIILPNICRFKFFNMIITPILLSYYTVKTKSEIIISYHFIPHAMFASFASTISKKPYIVSQTGIYIQKYSQKKIVGKIIKHILKKARYVNVPGTSSKEFWTKSKIDIQKINLLHSTINTEKFLPTDSFPKYDFIFLGRLAVEKRINLIIEAFENLIKNHNEISLVIVGDGKQKEKLISIVREKKLEDKISFVGFQTNTNEWLNKAKIFVLSSFSEGLPTALMQAMACKLVCISTKVGNIQDMLINKQTGYTFDSDDVEELSRLMEYTYLHYNDLSGIRLEARKIIEKNHSYSSAIKSWTQIINKVEHEQSR